MGQFSMKARPFAIRYIPAQREGFLNLRTRLVRTDATRDDAGAELNRLLVLVRQLGSVGAFAGRLCPPPQSRISHIEVSVSEPGMMDFRLATTNVDHTLLLAVVNLLHRFSLDHEPLAEVTINSSLCEAAVSGSLPAHGYYAPLPFLFEDCMEGRRVVLTLDFVEPQADVTRAGFAALWKAWVALAQAGAFADDSYDIDSSTGHSSRSRLSRCPQA